MTKNKMKVINNILLWYEQGIEIYPLEKEEFDTLIDYFRYETKDEINYIVRG